jgi:hypothetical protein
LSTGHFLCTRHRQDLLQVREWGGFADNWFLLRCLIKYLSELNREQARLRQGVYESSSAREGPRLPRPRPRPRPRSPRPRARSASPTSRSATTTTLTQCMYVCMYVVWCTYMYSHRFSAQSLEALDEQRIWPKGHCAR